MGCVASRIEKKERVQVCKERRRLMRQLVLYRGEFADAQLAYLRGLKNTGATLRQFTESETLELESTPYSMTLPHSPPPPLPLSPPPPPPLSPNSPEADDEKKEVAQEECMDINGELCGTSLSWSGLNIFEVIMSYDHPKGSETEEHVDEEHWAETRMEFEDEVEEPVVDEQNNTSPLPWKPQPGEIADDNSSTMSWNTKGTADMPMVTWRKKNNLEGVIKQLDDYFLQASAGGKELAIFVDINRGNNYYPWSFKESKRKRSNPAKVFSALSWSWSSKSLQHTREDLSSGSSEPCRPGAHCVTLEKLHDAEQKLYKEVKEEEITKIEHKRKLMMLQKQEEENQDWTRIEKTRLSVESLENDVKQLQYSITTTCSSILELIDKELYPQLVMLTSGLKHMWRMMYECHQIQNQISQQLSHLTEHQSVELTTELRRQAAAQLVTEVACWYNTFNRLVKSQQEYVKALCKWIQLTDCLVDGNQQSSCSSMIHNLCEEWQNVFEKLPDKVVSEAIKNFLLAIESVIEQQTEEQNQQRKADKLERKLQRELIALTEMEKKAAESLATADVDFSLTPKHPLLQKRAKTDALKKLVDAERAKYQNSVHVTKTMILNNFKTSLPNVFQSLMIFSKASAQAFDTIHRHVKPEIRNDASENSGHLSQA